MKKLLSLLLVVTMLLSLAVPFAVAADISCGDVDEDNGITASDALEILKSVVGKVTLTNEQIIVADVDGNGMVDAADALLILKKVVGKIECFPVEEKDYTDSGEGLVYLDDVVNKPTLNWESVDDKMIVPEGEAIPEVGTIITFGTEKAIKVESMETVNGQTVITYSKPEFNEFLDYIDIESEIVPKNTDFVPAENIVATMHAETHATYGAADDWLDVPAGSINAGIVTTLEPENPIKLKNGLELSFSVDLMIRTIDYKFDIDFDADPFNDIPAVLVKDAYIKASHDITAHVSIGRGVNTGDEEFDDSIFDDIGGDKPIDLGSIPLVGIEGLCLEVELDAIITAEGKVDIAYNIHGTTGAQILNNKRKDIAEFQGEMLSLGIEAEASAGLQVGFEAEFFGEDLFNFAFGGGVKVAGSIALRSNGTICMDGNAHIYLELKLLEDCLIDEWLNIGVTYPIWDEENSPIKISGHWENLKKVSDCTFENTPTHKDNVICDCDSLTSWDTAYFYNDGFNTEASLDSRHTQGTNSIKMECTDPDNNHNWYDYSLGERVYPKIGGQIYYHLDSDLDLTPYNTVSFDLYCSRQMTGSHDFQINLASYEGDGADDDGYNYRFSISGWSAGWHTVTFNLSSIPPAVPSADWSKIPRLRFTWYNYGLDPQETYFLIDNIRCY